MLRRLNIERFVLWLGGPYFTSSLVGRFGNVPVCYSLCEDFAEKDARNRRMIRRENDRLVKKADVVFVVSEELARKAGGDRRKVHVIPNAVDVESVLEHKEQVCRPEEVKGLPRPIIGFVGGIDDGVDMDLVLYLAGQRPDWSIVMIGPYCFSSDTVRRWRAQHCNLHLPGSRPFGDVATYVKEFDVCMLPFKDNARNRSRSAMKLYLYMALGKRIVARPVADAERFGSVVELARSKDDFLSAIDRCLVHSDRNEKKTIVDTARQQTWDNRAERIHNLLVCLDHSSNRPSGKDFLNKSLKCQEYH
jgi:hypothetical protein